MSLVVRRAGPADAAALVALNRQFNGVEMPARLVARRLAGNRSEVVLLACADGAAIGFACVQLARSVCYPHPWAEVTEVYVERARRRKGVGRALLAAAERVARRRGAAQVAILTGARNAAGRRLYAAAGYRGSPKRLFLRTLERPRRTAAGGQRP